MVRTPLGVVGQVFPDFFECAGKPRRVVGEHRSACICQILPAAEHEQVGEAAEQRCEDGKPHGNQDERSGVFVALSSCTPEQAAEQDFGGEGDGADDAGGTPGTKTTPDEKGEALERELAGVIPMGIPMLAGPGAISIVMLYMSRDDLFEGAMVFAAIAATMAVTYVMLRYTVSSSCEWAQRARWSSPGPLGLILATVAVQFINGIHGVAVEWAGKLDAMF